MKIGIGQAAKELGVSRETLQRWEAAGKIQVERTPQGHRCYDLSKLHGLTRGPSLTSRPTLADSRVSSYTRRKTWCIRWRC